MKRKIGEIKFTREQQKEQLVLMFDEVLTRYLEAERELSQALNFMASKALKAKIPELTARRDEKRNTLVEAYREALG